MTKEELLQFVTELDDDEQYNVKKARRTKKKKITGSKLIAYWMLALTSIVSLITLHLMYLCISHSYTGAMYPLSALIALCQAGNAIVLSSYSKKSKAENTRGGIVYDSAMYDMKRDA